MKILSVQPGSLYQNGGVGRLLRRLYQGKETQVTSLYVTNSSARIGENEIKEIPIFEFPQQRSWMRWKLRPFFAWLRKTVFFSRTKQNLKNTALKIPFDVLHIINHGAYSNVLLEDEFIANKQLWVSFHDHFSLCSSFDNAKQLWTLANRRLVISQELGDEYKKLFGDKDFELITDGVDESEISTPKEINTKETVIYFAGLLHIDYYPLFEVLANAIDQLSTVNRSFTLVLRGAQKLSFLDNRKFKVDYRKDFVSDAAIKEELDSADILYLPIKFTEPDFYLYSLSTKMIGYLGSAGRILFHGPSDSAASRALMRNNAAISCDTLQVEDMLNSIHEILEPNILVSENAKKMAQNYFVLNKIQNTFWNKK